MAKAEAFAELYKYLCKEDTNTEPTAESLTKEEYSTGVRTLSQGDEGVLITRSGNRYSPLPVSTMNNNTTNTNTTSTTSYTNTLHAAAASIVPIKVLPTSASIREFDGENPQYKADQSDLIMLTSRTTESLPEAFSNQTVR